MTIDESTYLYFRIAEWFGTNPPGTLVPEWCGLSWPLREETIQELIQLYEADMNEHVDGTPLE